MAQRPWRVKKDKAPQASKSKRNEVLPDLEDEVPVVNNQKYERSKGKEKKNSKHKSKKIVPVGNKP